MSAPARASTPASGAAPLLRIAHLSKTFGGLHAVRDVSFDLAAGEMLALIGPNGAGKTTCFNMVNGQLKPDSGSVVLAGTELIGLRPDRIWRLGVGRTFQIASGFRPTSSTPASLTEPASGASCPPTMLKQVVLPAPFGPISASISPAPRSKLTRSTARTPPNALARSRTASTGALMPCRGASCAMPASPRVRWA